MTAWLPYSYIHSPAFYQIYGRSEVTKIQNCVRSQVSVPQQLLSPGSPSVLSDPTQQKLSRGRNSWRLTGVFKIQYRNTWHGQGIVCGQLDVHVGQAVVQAWPCQSLKF